MNPPHPIYHIVRYIKQTGDNAEKLQQLYDDHFTLFQRAKGSMYNHQAWPGGYLQHVCDCIQIAKKYYNIPWPMPFEFSSVILVLFLHDIEKPFMQKEMELSVNPKPWSKPKRLLFQGEIIAKYDLRLTTTETQALVHIHGEGDDYSNEHRVMNELGGFCHAADVLSARLWPDRNKP